MKKNKNKKIKPNSEYKKNHPLGHLTHKMKPVHVFHNQQIDRWVVLMDCANCKKMHVFYPFK